MRWLEQTRKKEWEAISITPTNPKTLKTNKKDYEKKNARRKKRKSTGKIKFYSLFI
jgi:hypothetical protein